MSKFSEEPENNLTRLCAAMVDAIEDHPEYDGDEMVVITLVNHGEELGIQCRSAHRMDAAKLMLSAASSIIEEEGGRMEMIPMGDFAGTPNTDDLPASLAAMIKAALLRQRFCE